MAVFHTTWDKERDAAWSTFLSATSGLRPPGQPSQRFFSDDEERLLSLPKANWPLTRKADAELRRSMTLSVLDRERGRISQATDLLVRHPGLERLFDRLPAEPVHTVPLAPFIDLGAMHIPADVAPRGRTTPSARELACEIPEPLPEHVRAALADFSHDAIEVAVLRSAALHAALFSTTQALTAVDQMRLPNLDAVLGRSALSTASMVQLSCWFRINEDLRLLIAPRFAVIGGAIAASISHAILYMQPWMQLHPWDSHSWWLSLAEHADAHFRDSDGIYRESASAFFEQKADSHRVPMYYGDSRTTAALRGFLGSAGPRVAPKAEKSFYSSGPPDRRVAYSDTHRSFVCFAAQEWPFDAGSLPVAVFNTFRTVLGNEVAGLRARMQREPLAIP